MNLTTQEPCHKSHKQHYQNLFRYDCEEEKSVYFIGIGGVGMSAIANILMDEGCIVSGSDLECTPITHNLREKGAKIYTKQDGNSLNHYTDLVIASAAINESNPDLLKARKLGLEVVKYSEFLGSLMKDRRGIAVSGTHGKTTTSAMISTILKKAGHEPTCVVGGDIIEIGGSSCVGKGTLFVAEACEYDKTFLHLSPQIGVITNIDEDHLDYYKNIRGITDAFSEFASLIPEDGLLVVDGGDENIKTALTNARCQIAKFSVVLARDDKQTVDLLDSFFPRTIPDVFMDEDLGSMCDKPETKWLAVVYHFDKALSIFSVYNERGFFGNFSLPVPGIHNVKNALAAITVCRSIGLRAEVIKKALQSFKGVSRRFETVCNENGITIIDDYAHHPTEIRTTLETVKSVYPSQQVTCVFQPHQYNRTRFFLKEFAASLSLADRVIVTDIYAARDSGIDKASVSSLDLVHELFEMGGNVHYMKTISEIVNGLHMEAKKGDIILTMGAGDIWKAAYGFRDLVKKGHDNAYKNR
ncbi:MAG: UDP-N-acetylmuramate--L-alanine ligase [Candidatus Scalindua sp. AMX11]|nr:MAG: UDP-N-acetylmuramate--L-alanine ligase [Candidatus Scalindua sp.]NOG85606.1 UDP-N-acetylmuramate--L-alanine ligase [Planctomycetota bacterium]RZV65372.1 MAG: UDP-N-acetylmuramate--L-alanine ligase [Candidatus Scalindua sp. SCAELEC01]TDE63474.1 MAG: UDP-N-acetylmuramate--L-alanine ligase [Candidatus Scalindua sp. AMX11]GJQ57292.1 MAG: UDP-N-acetylmuramate--L-alanine ligase [Candidatus Scalindua sp.]